MSENSLGIGYDSVEKQNAFLALPAEDRKHLVWVHLERANAIIRTEIARILSEKKRSEYAKIDSENVDANSQYPLSEVYRYKCFNQNLPVDEQLISLTDYPDTKWLKMSLWSSARSILVLQQDITKDGDLSRNDWSISKLNTLKCRSATVEESQQLYNMWEPQLCSPEIYRVYITPLDAFSLETEWTNTGWIHEMKNWLFWHTTHYKPDSTSNDFQPLIPRANNHKIAILGVLDVPNPVIEISVEEKRDCNREDLFQ